MLIAEEEVKQTTATADPLPTTDPVHRGFTLASVRVIQGFLEAGKLNLQKNPTQHGFLCLFTAWLIEDDLPFTIGESLALKRLYEYMDS